MACAPRALLLEYDPAILKAAVEAVPLADEKLRENWGDRLHRIALELRTERAAGSYALTFRPAGRF